MANEKRLIYADELRQTIESKIYWGGTGLLEAIDEAPTVDAVEVVHGRWIKVHEWCGVEVLKCSACGREHPRLQTAYCCDCGAKMDGGNEDGKTD